MVFLNYLKTCLSPARVTNFQCEVVPAETESVTAAKQIHRSPLLRRYISEVTRTAWWLVNQNPPYELDTDLNTPFRLNHKKHSRHHSSKRDGEIVRAFLWPALLRGGNCVHKAVVVTE